MASRGGRTGRVRASSLGGRGARIVDAGHDYSTDTAAGGVRATGKLAWLLYGGVVAQFAIGMLVWAVVHRRGSGAALDPIGALATGLPFATLGVVVARRRPEQRLGWLFLAIGLGLAAMFMLEPAAVAFDQYGASVTAAAAVWVWSIVDWTVLGAFIAVLVLFPTGQLASRWSRFLLWVTAVSVICGWIDRTFPPGDRTVLLRVGNPFGFDALPTVLAWAVEVGVVLYPAALVCAIAALLVRFARARGRERQQLKVFLYAVAMGGAVFLLPSVVRVPFVAGLLDTPAGNAVRWISLPVAVAVGIGAAILRHGLYDIDRIISRTVVYAGVTAVLGLGYSVVVLLSGQLFGADEDMPAWVVACATLAAAAVFRPVRHAIQTRVERR